MSDSENDILNQCIEMEEKLSRETGTSTTFNNSGGDSLHLHGEIEMLKSQIIVKDDQINKLETSVFSGHRVSEGEISYLRSEIIIFNDKYERLFDAHRRIQKVNQNLEDKLLKIADRFESEKCALLVEVSDLKRKVLDAKVTISELHEENERFKNDCNLAVNLLQCKPSNFITQRLEHIPQNIQERLKGHSVQKSVTSKETDECERISMPIATFPPTAMVFSVNKNQRQSSSNDSSIASSTLDGEGSGEMISTAALARVLKPKRNSATNRTRMYLCKACKSDVDVCERSTQTSPQQCFSSRDLPQTHCFMSQTLPKGHLHRNDSTTSTGSRESEV